MHTMNGVNVELTTRTGLVNDGRVYVRRRGSAASDLFIFVSCHVFIHGRILKVSF